MSEVIVSKAEVKPSKMLATPRVTVSVTEEGISTVFEKIRDKARFRVPTGNWVGFGPLRLRLVGANAHLENGRFRIINVAGDVRGQLKEVDIVWDRLDIGVGLDVPQVCVGGYCLLKVAGRCLIQLPKKCFFTRNPDLSATISFAGLRNEISSALDFEVARKADRFQLFVKPKPPLDIDFIDISDTVGDILDRIVEAFVNQLLSFLPDWARDLVKAILGGLSTLIRRLLDLGDDVMEWISEKIGVSLGLINLCISFVLEYFYNPDPILEIENPKKILEEDVGSRLPAVYAPVKDFTIAFYESPNRLEVALNL